MGSPSRDRAFEAGCGRLIRARIRARQGHTGDAVADYREAIRLLEAGSGADGEATARVLVRAATELAALVKDGGNVEDVRQALGRAVELTRAEVERQPKSAPAQAALARALEDTAAAAVRARQPEEAEALLREAIAVNGRRSDPASVGRLARAHTNLGRLLRAAGRAADARAAFDAAERAARRLAWDVAFLRADLLFTEGKEREGMAALRPLLDDPSTDRRAFRAVARLNGVLARLAKDASRPADEKEQLAKEAASDAVAFLRLAVRRGARWADPEFPRMTPLRDRPEFKAAEPELREQ